MQTPIKRKGRFRGSTPREITWIVTGSGCHECTSHKPNRNVCGYIRLNRDGRHIMLHREVYSNAYLNGSTIPDGLVVRHKCDNSICINPDHLEIGTQQDNIQDTIKRGRNVVQRGSKNSLSKLKEFQVYDILRLPFSMTNYEVADIYGVAYTVISKIRRRELWLHVTPPDGYKIPEIRSRKKCTICCKPAVGHGYCSLHAQRFAKHGNPLIGSYGYVGAERQPQKVSEQDKIEILKLLSEGVSQYKIAERFNISQAMVSLIKKQLEVWACGSEG